MSYRQVLDEAIGDAPVSKVDVDAVITRQRRAGKLRRWGACGAGAVAVLAVIATAVHVLPGQRLTEQTAERPITTVAGTPADMTRLDNAVFAAVKREVPGLTWVDTPTWRHDGGDKNTAIGYWGQGGVSAGGAKGHFMMGIQRYGELRSGGWVCVDRPDSTCRESAGPNGERITTRVPAGKQRARMSAQRVEVLRPADDTLVLVSLMDDVEPNGLHAMTLEQLTAIALDPAIALAPVPPGVVVTPPKPAPSESPGQPTVKPTDTSGPADPAEQRRITNAIFASLRKQVPGVQVPANWWIPPDENTADTYFGQATLVVNGVSGLFSVQMSRTDPGLYGDLKCGKLSKTYACTAGTGPHGERYRTVTNTSRNGSAERDVQVRRKDGSWLSVTLSANPPAGKFGLTAAKQQAIAFDQAIGWKAR